MRLLTRTTRSVSPTEAGEQLLAHLRPALADIRGTLTTLSGLQSRPVGRVRLLCPRLAAKTVLAPKLGQLVRDYPDVLLEVTTKGPVTIGLVVSSTEKTACTLTPERRPGRRDQRQQGAVWDSTVCKTSLLDDPVSVSPRLGDARPGDLVGSWLGQQVHAKEGFATPGKYTIQVGTLGGEPGKTTFTLTASPRPSRTVTPTKPTPSAKNTTKPGRLRRSDVAFEDARLGEAGQAFAYAAGTQVADAFDDLEVLHAGGEQLLQRTEVLDQPSTTVEGRRGMRASSR